MTALSRLSDNAWVRAAVGVAIAAVLVILPLTSAPFTNQTITRIAVFAVAVLGLNVVMGYAGQVSLGQIFFVGVGAYAAAITIRSDWGMALGFWGVVVGFVLAVVLSGVLGLIVSLAAARLRGLAIAMVTVALPIVGVPVAKRMSDLTGGSQGISARVFGAPEWTGLDNDQWQYYVVMTIGAAVFALTFFLVRGKYGRAFAIVKENEAVAASMGISPYRYKVLAFTTASMLGGVAGFLYLVAIQFTSPDTLSFGHSIELVIATIVGGAGSIVGSILGGVYYVLVPQLTNAVNPNSTAVVQGVVVLVVLFFLQGGLASLPRAIRRLVRRGRGSDVSASAATAPRNPDAEPPPDDAASSTRENRERHQA
ncbi:branched-chain amino acid ABC transporter permease [Microbacterium ulmi]|uniref:Branched-chain amino acid ABC transporter permease n=1 Tax=Microbacterium ulmi TaxID=179095 RepID=A0A7Y2LZJ4_9MICO|nr:branched-chain amino acid ABC transporter permease [Microbacterium ulmi]NII69186.1 branched-chain amino acid transport system permease protein [Microbacterium ulmi]NNH03726.1 branched-chain amino acid ABC transporter permease [Microbacterium ulmi]